MDNYIKHDMNVSEKLAYDNRINAFHISLYRSIILEASSEGFPEGIDIPVELILKLAKINLQEYKKYIKELAEWQYIRYYPSKHTLQPEIVELIDFSTLND